jgi:hypothetical protein
MTFQPALNCAEIVIDYLIDGAATANVLHVWDAAGFNQGALDAVASIVDGLAGADCAADMTPASHYVGTRVRGLSLQNDLQAAAAAGACAGTQIEDALPNSVSLCLTLRTPSLGRSARGRFYCQRPRVSQMVTNNTVEAGYITERVAFLNGIKSALAAASVELVILSRWANKVQRPSAVFFPVTVIQARNSRVDSQRGRMPNPV